MSNGCGIRIPFSGSSVGRILSWTAGFDCLTFNRLAFKFGSLFNGLMEAAAGAILAIEGLIGNFEVPSESLRSRSSTTPMDSDAALLFPLRFQPDSWADEDGTKLLGR